MPTFKQQIGIAATTLIAIVGVGAAVLFSLDRAGIHAPGPDPGSSLSASSDSGTTDSLPSDTSSVDGAAAQAPQPSDESSAAAQLQAAFGPVARKSTGADSPQSEAEPLVTTSVRTTAYTHTEADHLKYGKKTALGSDLQYTTEYHSAAADWSRFPLGTKFRMQGVDRLFVVDDYGKALVGSDTIDIYFPTKERMNNWGVRWINIDVVEFGNFHASRKILAARANYPHCREMLSSMTSDDWWKQYRDSAP